MFKIILTLKANSLHCGFKSRLHRLQIVHITHNYRFEPQLWLSLSNFLVALEKMKNIGLPLFYCDARSQ